MIELGFVDEVVSQLTHLVIVKLFIVRLGCG